MTRATRQLKRDMERSPKALIRLLVWFANVRIRSTAQVEGMYMRATGRTTAMFNQIPASDVDAYRDRDQPTARAWLDRVLIFDKASPAERQAFRDEVAAIVEAKAGSRPRAVFGPDRFSLAWEWSADQGVEFINGYAVASLLGDPKLRRRLGRCELGECRKFFYDTRPRGGLRMEYCESKHSELGRKRKQRRDPEGA